MGINERDYGRESTPWDRIENPRNITITLIVINVIVFVAQMLFNTDQIDPETGIALRHGISGQVIQTNQLQDWAAVSGHTLIRPWLWWQFLSYGFLHDNQGITHLLFNMIGLFFFGRIIERTIGRMEFLRFYLVAIVVGGVVGALASFVATQFMGGALVSTIGASGGVLAVVLLFIFHFPQQEILIFGVFPIKAWVAGAFYIGSNLLGALGITQGMGGGANTAFTVHLAGIAFAAAYHYRHWNLSFLAPESLHDLPDRMRKRARRAKLKIHDPDQKIAQEADEADRILAKIHASGEASLTGAERKTLQRYSKRQREKRDQ